MLPTTFKESNQVLAKPQDMTDEECMGLPIWRGNVTIDDTGSQYPALISCWKFSYEDLQAIQKTVSLFTENPFVQTTES